MRKLISSEYKHLLYRDKCRDTFLITKFMEIYRKSKTTLGCTCWSYKTLVKLRSKGIIFNEWATADGLYQFDTRNENLDVLIQCGAPKRRIHKKGKFLKSRERKLGHLIIPFKPIIN
ncbi:MAG: hypothetical protein P9L95_10360 [Candidatus Tenebribacter mawsonii]|nr:hypothetical protein [Candidatus Tenebribacter mawsonii]